MPGPLRRMVARRIRIERCGDAWLWIGGPVAPGADATTIGALILVRRAAADGELLLAHEQEHVRQYREQGFVGFLARYLGAYLRGRAHGWAHWSAYRRIPFEVEAEWRARRRLGIGVVVDCAGAGDAAAGAPPPAGDRDERRVPVRRDD